MLNKVILMGRLTHDPELRKTASDKSVTSFSLAVDRNYAKDKEKRETDFLDCVAWRNTAEFICRNFAKGSLIAVVGRLEVRPWEDKQGQKRRSTEIIVDDVYFTGDRRENADATQGATDSGPSFPTDSGNAPSFPESLDDVMNLDGLELPL